MAEKTKWVARGSFARVLSSVTLVSVLAACGHDTENGAQSARIAALEEEVHRLGASLTALQSGTSNSRRSPAKAAGSNTPFKIECPQPWLLQTPLGATLWNCRSPTATPEGLYPQCSISVQPHHAIELRNYVEFAWNASPQLRPVKSLEDKPIKIKDHDGFQVISEADPKPVVVKMRSVLVPQAEQVYTVTCFAPSGSFDDYDAKAFQKIIATIAFPQ